MVYSSNTLEELSLQQMPSLFSLQDDKVTSLFTAPIFMLLVFRMVSSLFGFMLTWHLYTLGMIQVETKPNVTVLK